MSERLPTIDPNNYCHRLMRVEYDGMVTTLCGFTIAFALKSPDGELKPDCPMCLSAQYDPFPPRKFLPYF